MNTSTTHVIRATLNWAKVLGEPRMNTYTKEREWSVDATPLREEDRDELKRIGISDRLKEPKDNDFRKESFLAFRQKESRTDLKTGEVVKNKPIKIVNAANQAWPDNELLGNGTIGEVKFTVRPYGPGKPTGVYIQAIRVLKHEPYESQDFAPLSPDDEFFASGDDAKPAEPLFDTDTDDEVPY